MRHWVLEEMNTLSTHDKMSVEARKYGCGTQKTRDLEGAKRTRKWGENPASAIGQRVRRARRDLGWSLQELATASGLSPGYISRIENGRSEFSLKTLSCLAMALRRRISWLAEPLNEAHRRRHRSKAKART